MTVDTGLFGKIPEAGDFIVRGIAPVYRRGLDRWVTKHLSGRDQGWPIGGLRGLIEVEGALLLIVAVPSLDKVGRQFPLLAVVEGVGVSLEDAEGWCDEASSVLGRMVLGELGLDESFATLTELSLKRHDNLENEQALWTVGETPMPCDAETLDQVFSSD